MAVTLSDISDMQQLRDFIAPMALASVAQDKQPVRCIGCHSCSKVCPQAIKIPEALHSFAEKMGMA